MIKPNRENKIIFDLHVFKDHTFFFLGIKSEDQLCMINNLNMQFFVVLQKQMRLVCIFGRLRMPGSQTLALLTFLDIVFGGCPVYGEMFSCIPGLYPPDISSSITHTITTLKTLSRHCQMSPGGTITPRVQNAELNQFTCLKQMLRNSALMCF